MFCSLFPICKVSTRGINPDLNRRGMGEKEAKEANQTLLIIGCWRRKFCVTAAKQFTPREISPGCGQHLRAPKPLAFPYWPLTPRQRCGRSAGAEPPPWCRPCAPRCGGRAGEPSPWCHFPAAGKPPGHGLAAKLLPEVWNHPATHNGRRQGVLQTLHGAGRGSQEIWALRTEMAQIQPRVAWCKLKVPCNDPEIGVKCWWTMFQILKTPFWHSRPNIKL